MPLPLQYQADRRTASDPVGEVPGCATGATPPEVRHLSRPAGTSSSTHGETLADGASYRESGAQLKVWREGRPDPLADGLRQVDDYLSRLGLDAGTLIIFDRRPDAVPIHERARVTQVRTPFGRPVAMLRA